MALSTRRMLTVIAAVALAAAFALAATSLVPSADSSPAQAAKKKRKKKKKRFNVSTSCSNEHTPLPPAGSGEDFGRLDATVRRRTRSRGSRSAALVPVKGAKVSGKLTDRTPADGDNATVKEDSAKTDAAGKAQLEFQFNNFGNYRITYKVSKKGFKTKRGSVDFGVQNRDSGACEPAT